ncbi:MAG: Fe-Mn family superoxide dismutase [Anaerolineaceae bacterium]|nr:Fe-Mn family superoxide dismutase [Anaerolineaceae bacterium]
MRPRGGNEPPAALKQKIEDSFGSFDACKEELASASVSQFGSGWVWLVLDGGKLKVVKTANAGGLSMEKFDTIRQGATADRSQFYKDLAGGPFFGANRPGAKVSQGMIDSFWLQGMQAGAKNTFDCIKAFSETDFTENLKKFGVLTLIIHGDDDQIVPMNGSKAARSCPPYPRRSGDGQRTRRR